eukprot:205357_1
MATSDLECDILVVGAGVIGSSITYYLCKLNEDLPTNKKKKILWIEQYELSHNKGSSHGDGRITRISDIDSFKCKMAKRSYKLYKLLQLESNENIMRDTNYLAFGQKNNNKYIRQQYKNNKLMNVKQKLLTTAEDMQLLTPLNIDANKEIGLLQSKGLILFADKIVNALHTLIENKYNLSLKQNCKITQIRTQNNVVTYSENNQEKQIKFSDKIILATGAYTNHILKCSNLSQIPYTIINQQATYFKPKKGFESDFDINVNPNCTMPVWKRHQDSNDNDTINVCMSDIDENNEYEVKKLLFEKYGYYGIPMVSSLGVKVDVSRVKNCDNGDFICLDDLIENKRSFSINKNLLKYSQIFVRHYFPNLEVNNYNIIRCLYTTPIDNKYVIGKHFECDNVFLCFGFCGNGYKMAQIVGLSVAKKVLKYNASDKYEEYDIDMSRYKAQRFACKQQSKL